MGSGITILTLADRQRWEELEATDAAPSQCWRFAAALTHSGYHPRLAVVDAAGSRLMLPYVERRWGGCTDIATYPSPSGASIVPASTMPLARWHEHAVGSGWVSGYIQLSPATFPNVWSDAHPIHRMQAFLLDVTDWDVRRSPSEIIRRKHAAAIRRSATVCDDRTVIGRDFWALHCALLSRFGSRPRLTEATVEHWIDDPQNLLIGVMVEGRVEAAHLVNVHRDEAELHLVGSTERGRPLSALLYVAVIEHLRGQGVKRYNLGGGGNPGDGLHTFKSWLGAKPVPLLCVRQVYDAGRYAELCVAAGVQHEGAYLPGYRTGNSHQNG